MPAGTHCENQPSPAPSQSGSPLLALSTRTTWLVDGSSPGTGTFSATALAGSMLEVGAEPAGSRSEAGVEVAVSAAGSGDGASSWAPSGAVANSGLSASNASAQQSPRPWSCNMGGGLGQARSNRPQARDEQATAGIAVRTALLVSAAANGSVQCGTQRRQ